MAVSYRFIRNSEVAIKGRERYSSKLSTTLRGDGWGLFFSTTKIRGMPSRLSEYITELAVLQEFLGNLQMD